ncbi:MAG: hypothetical protein J5I65_14510 [Aridibacter famidurans]|nr:hypothetical protein [Aridibacter famidurans]
MDKRLPEPSGEYRVGTTVRFFADESREEPWTGTAGDRRRLAVQFWYPTAARSGREAPYVPDLESIKASIEKYWGGIPQAETGAFLDAPPLKSGDGLPLVLLSHGMNSPRFVYTAISRELASRGYIVGTIDHSYWGPGVAFPDGDPVRFEDGMISLDTLESDEIDSMMIEGVNVMAADQAFVAFQVVELNKSDRILKGAFKSGSAAAMGHAMGGMAAINSCLRYTAFSSCVSLDGVFYFLSKMPKPSEKPLLLLLNSQWGRGAPEKIAGRYLEAFNNPQVAILKGSKHSYFSDIPLIERPAELDGLLAPEHAFRIIAEETAAFLDANLRGVERKSRKAEELETVDLSVLRARADPK